VLHCVAVCCSVLQCVAVCCSVLQCVAVCCSVLQCVALCCSVLPPYPIVTPSSFKSEGVSTIFKSQLAHRCTVQNDYRSDF